MYKYFLKPIWIIFWVYLMGFLSIAANVAQLTNFNVLDFLEKHSPESYYFVLGGTLLLYIVLVIIEFIRNKPIQQWPAKAEQIIKTGNVKNSTIIQIKQDKKAK